MNHFKNALNPENKIHDILEAVQLSSQKANPLEWQQKIISCIDFTRLNDTDDEASISAFFQKAESLPGHVAAVCVYPRFVKMAVAEFAKTPIKVATVVNFPHGTSSVEDTLVEIGRSLLEGAQEIDVVFPYSRFLAGDKDYAHTFVEACKSACGELVLKVILETGALKEVDRIAEAAQIALKAGADFVKTSTGKIQPGATFEAAATLLLAIQAFQAANSTRQVGLKVSGGINALQDAIAYFQLAETIMGQGWAEPRTFRIGTSKLVDKLLALSPIVK